MSTSDSRTRRTLFLVGLSVLLSWLIVPIAPAVAATDFATPPQVSINDTTPTVKQTVSAVLDTASDPDADAYAYQWFTDDGVNPPVPIPGARSQSYTIMIVDMGWYEPNAPDVGPALRVQVTASKTGYNDASAMSAATAAVAKADFTTPPTVTITGTPKVDEALTAVAQGEVPESGHVFQWKADDIAISGATYGRFTPSAAEVGKAITVTVRATRPGYNPSEPATSAPTAPVEKADFGGFDGVVIDDWNPAVGQTLTATISDTSPVQDAFAFQWYRGSSPIGGATDSTYKVTNGDLGSTIAVKCTAIKLGYNDMTHTSLETAPVSIDGGPGTFVTAPKANLSTTAPKVGDLVWANPNGAVPDDGMYQFQWYRTNSLGVRTAIPGAVNSGYRVLDNDLTKKLQVEITSIRPGYTSLVTRSAWTARVNFLTCGPWVAPGKTLAVNAKRLRAGQAYRIYIDGVAVYKGTASSTGSVIRSVVVPRTIGTGIKRVWVSGYNRAGVRDFQVMVSITVSNEPQPPT